VGEGQLASAQLSFPQLPSARLASAQLSSAHVETCRWHQGGRKGRRLMMLTGFAVGIGLQIMT
jgi:hypothetical protein